MAKLTLWFSKYEAISLERTAFKHPLLQHEQLCVRGKTAGALTGYQTFQWTPAVQALSILLLKAAAAPASANYLEGEHGTPASSLDYALGKEPSWILDMFGVDSHGRALAKRLLKRTNPERKRPGPVILALNTSLLRAEEVQVYLNNVEITDNAVLVEIAKAIETNWKRSSRSEQAADAMIASTDIEAGRLLGLQEAA